MSDTSLARRSPDLLERLFRSSPAAIALVRTGDGVVLDANDAYERLFGWRREEAIGRSAEALRVWVHPEERARFRSLLASKGRVVDFESKARRRDGTEFDSLMSAEVLQEAGERIALVIVNDVSARRRAEDARALLGAVVETSSDAIIVSDPDMRIVSWNAGAERLFGWSAGEAAGRELSMIVPPERWQETLGNTERMRRGEAAPTFETVRVARGGRRIDVQVSVSGVYEAGRLKLVAGIFRDISERKRAEEALRASEMRFAQMFRQAPEFMALVRVADERIVDVNQVFERVTGCTRAEMVGHTSAEVPLWADLEHRRRVFDELRAHGGVHDVEFLLRRRDGSTRHALLDGVTLDMAGEPCWLLVTRDITERKRGEDALRESEQRFRALVELSSDWYWATDTEHRFTFLEGEILRRMGFAAENDYGKRRWEMGFLNLSEQDWAEHRAVLERREEFRDLLLERRGADERIHWVAISGRPLYDAQGHFAGYHGTGRDVTRQIVAEQGLRRFNVELEMKVARRTEALDAANRELEAFSYSVSHDLRGPLQIIDGFAELLEERLAGMLDGEARRYFAELHGAARRMNRLIDDLLALSRASRAELVKQPVDLSALARSVAQEIDARDAQRRVTWRIADGLGALADPGLMRIVLENLLGNAWKYTGRRDDACIEVERNSAGEIVVRDNGIGFDQAQAGTLFEPFHRLEGARAFDGSGVGLATVDRIVQRHGGRVRAEGASGEGAAFYVWLPPERRQAGR